MPNWLPEYVARIAKPYIPYTLSYVRLLCFAYQLITLSHPFCVCVCICCYCCIRVRACVRALNFFLHKVVPSFSTKTPTNILLLLLHFLTQNEFLSVNWCAFIERTILRHRVSNRFHSGACWILIYAKRVFWSNWLCGHWGFWCGLFVFSLSLFFSFVIRGIIHSTSVKFTVFCSLNVMQ